MTLLVIRDSLTDLFANLFQATKNLKDICRKYGTLDVNEDDIIDFIPQDLALVQRLKDTGFIGGSAFAPACKAEGDGLKRGILNKDATYVSFIRFLLWDWSHFFLSRDNYADSSSP